MDTRLIKNFASGGLALLLLVVVDFSVVLGMRGVSIGEYFAMRDSVAMGVYLVMLVAFAVMPWLLRKSR